MAYPEPLRVLGYAMNPTKDTIVALATPAGRGGLGVVRVSGPDVPALAAAVIGELPPPRVATLRRFRGADGEALDTGLVLFFPAPHSFTGESILELHGHGGPVVLGLLVERFVALGARRARPGEFTERAFLNDKLDLAQAEAIADLIDAGSAQAARAALRSLDGAFSVAVQGLTDGVTGLRLFVEAAIDFPDEEVEFLADGKVAARLEALRTDLQTLTQRAAEGARLRDGLTLVIAGAPNAGKSSLLNALAGHAAAIVTPIPGTTRDVLRERLDLDGVPLHLVDTAGLRLTDDPIEQEGVRRARVELARADAVLLVVDSTAPPVDLRSELPAGVPVIEVRNKIDLPGAARGTAPGAVHLSALTGEGLDGLRAALRELFHLGATGEDAISARQRHLEALARAATHLENAASRLAAGQGELVAEELRLTQQALGEITGEVTPDDLLGRIFASFCIGK
jgi:tRNA modification GTPase